MGEETTVLIKKLIVHILDSNLHMPLLSGGEHPEDSEIDDFVQKHVIKILKDEGLKSSSFIGETNRAREICREIAYNNEYFREGTSELAGILFGIIKKNADIPSADMLCCLLEIDGIMHLGILKLNYRNSYIHYVRTLDKGAVNSIIKQKTALAPEGQKIDECILINLQNMDINLIEKKYDINGEKAFYISNLFLNCTSSLSGKEKLKIFKKATENFRKEFFEDDFAKAAEIRRAVSDSIDENNGINVIEVAENAFSSNHELQKSYIEHVERAGLAERIVKVSETAAEKNFRRQRIRTDTGIEINLPVDFYNDAQKVEFINNPDGTISIIIKNISKITDV